MAIRSPFAMVLVPVVGTLVCHAAVVMPPPPPVNTAATSKVMTFVTLTARTGGPVVASTAPMPTLTVVPALANVLGPDRHGIEPQPVVSMVCEPPSSHHSLPAKITASLVAAIK